MAYFVKPLERAKWCVNREIVEVTPDDLVVFSDLADAMHLCSANPPRGELIPADVVEAALAGASPSEPETAVADGGQSGVAPAQKSRRR